MTGFRDSLGLLSAVVAGVILWGAATAFSGGRELWDLPWFGTVAYPAALLLSGALGAAFPRRAWLWGAVVFAVFAAFMFVPGRGDGALLPLGVVLVAVMSLPAMAVSAIAGWLRRRLSR